MLNSEDINSSFNYPSSKGKVMVVDTDYSTSNYPPDNDCEFCPIFPIYNRSNPPFSATSSGGSGSPEDAWSTPAQRGRHFPSHLPAAKPSYLYTNNSFNNSSSSFYSRPSTPVNFSVGDASKIKTAVAGSGADSWESRREAMEMLTDRYRDSIKVKDN